MGNLKVLSREAAEQVLDMHTVIDAVKEVYRLKAEGETVVFPLVSHEFEPGAADMDIKSGWLKGSHLFGLKAVSWFSRNTEKGLPALSGTIMVMDAETGIPKGILDGGYITGMRTGAAGAVGAKLLAEPGAENMLIAGTGQMAVFLAAAASELFPGLKKIRVYNRRHPEKAEAFAENLPQLLSNQFSSDVSRVSFEAVTDLPSAVSDSHMIFTATPSHEPFIRKEWVKPGTHFSCIGADMSGKIEIDPEIFADARVFTDDTPQCIRVGEIEQAVKTGILKPENIAGEIGDILTGKTEGRQNRDQITVFDATGTALLDLLTAEYALEKAEKLGLGESVNL